MTTKGSQRTAEEIKDLMFARIADRKAEMYGYPLVHVEVNIEAMAQGNKMNPDRLLKRLGDGTFASPHTEEWASLIYGFELNPDRNGVVDGWIRNIQFADYEHAPCNLLRDTTVSVKSMGAGGVGLQQSQQSGRLADWDPRYLTEGVSLADIQIITDICDPPHYYFIPFRTADFLSKMNYYLFSGKVKKIPERIKPKMIYEMMYDCGRDDLEFVDIPFNRIGE